MTERLRRPRCPQCGKPPHLYEEMWTRHLISFDADEEGRPEAEGHMGMGDPEFVRAHCRCGHRWRLRGITQIIQLEPQPERTTGLRPTRGVWTPRRSAGNAS